MEKILYKSLTARYTNAEGIVNWKAYNLDPEVIAAKAASKASKPAKTAKPSKHGEVIVVHDGRGTARQYIKPATPSAIAPIAYTPSKALGVREANVAALLRSIADLIEGK